MAERKFPVILMNMAVDDHNNRECEILISQYAERVSDAGGVPMLIPSIEKEENIRTLLSLADGVLLIGGKDYDPGYYGCAPHPQTSLERRRPHFDIGFGEAVLASSLPVLGICAGCQLLTIVAGGKLIQHLPDAELHANGVSHRAVIRRNGFFARAMSKEPGTVVTVNSFHHQAVDPEFPGTGFQIAAEAFDGSVEAIELPGPRLVLGVQFHPERLDDLGPGFFSLLVSEARRPSGR